MKKIILVLIIVVVLIVAVLLFYFNRSPKIEITMAEDLSLEFLGEKKVSDFIISINGNIIDDFLIDTTTVGKKTVDFTFINDDNKKAEYSYEITITDNIPPVIWLGDTYTATVESEIDLTEKIMCGDNADDNPEKYIEGDYDLNKIGNYPLTFVAIDSSGNETRKDFTLKVIEKSSTVKPPSKTVTLFSDVVEKYKNENTQIGIDISKWQGDIDFEKLKDAGVEFIIMRVGTAKGRDGEYVLDEKFEQNITEANKHNIPVGIYYFSYATGIEHAISDARWVLKQIEGYKVDLPIVYDWENWSNFNSYEMSFYKLTASANAFLNTCAEHGFNGMLYGSKKYLEEIWMPTAYPIWLAHYTAKTDYEGGYMIWQLCENGKVEGINEPVDINVLYK